MHVLDVILGSAQGARGPVPRSRIATHLTPAYGPRCSSTSRSWTKVATRTTVPKADSSPRAHCWNQWLMIMEPPHRTDFVLSTFAVRVPRAVLRDEHFPGWMRVRPLARRDVRYFVGVVDHHAEGAAQLTSAVHATETRIRCSARSLRRSLPICHYQHEGYRTP